MMIEKPLPPHVHFTISDPSSYLYFNDQRVRFDPSIEQLMNEGMYACVIMRSITMNPSMYHVIYR